MHYRLPAQAAQRCDSTRVTAPAISTNFDGAIIYKVYYLWLQQVQKINNLEVSRALELVLCRTCCSCHSSRLALCLQLPRVCASGTGHPLQTASTVSKLQVLQANVWAEETSILCLPVCVVQPVAISAL